MVDKSTVNTILIWLFASHRVVELFLAGDRHVYTFVAMSTRQCQHIKLVLTYLVDNSINRKDFIHFSSNSLARSCVEFSLLQCYAKQHLVLVDHRLDRRGGSVARTIQTDERRHARARAHKRKTLQRDAGGEGRYATLS